MASDEASDTATLAVMNIRLPPPMVAQLRSATTHTTVQGNGTFWGCLAHPGCRFRPQASTLLFDIHAAFLQIMEESTSTPQERQGDPPSHKEWTASSHSGLACPPETQFHGPEKLSHKSRKVHPRG